MCGGRGIEEGESGGAGERNGGKRGNLDPAYCNCTATCTCTCTVHLIHLKMMQLFVVEPEVHSAAGGCGQFHRDTPSAAPL